MPQTKKVRLACSHAGKKIRTLIADDSTEFRETVSAFLASLPDLEPRGEATNGQEAVRHHLDLILLELQMPDLDGLDRICPGSRTRRHADFCLCNQIPISRQQGKAPRGSGLVFRRPARPAALSGCAPSTASGDAAERMVPPLLIMELGVLWSVAQAEEIFVDSISASCSDRGVTHRLLNCRKRAGKPGGLTTIETLP